MTTHERSRTTRLLTCLAGIAVVSSCGGVEYEKRSAIPLAELNPPVVVGELTRQRLPSLADDTFAVFRAADMRIRDDTIFVADTGNDRILLFDLELQPIGVVGRSGGGPGELRMPLQLFVAESGLYVAERRNQRLSLFDRRGKYVRSSNYHFQSFMADFAVLPGGGIVASAPFPDYYLEQIGQGRSRRPLAQRTVRTPEPGSSRDAPLPVSTDKVVTIEDTIHVVDNDNGLMLKFDAAGRRAVARRFPDPIYEQVEDVYEQMAGPDRGGRLEVVRSYARSVTVTSENDILLTFSGRPEVYGAIVSPRDYVFTPVLISEQVENEDQLRSGRTAVLYDDELFVLDPYGILVYSIQPISSG